MLGKTFRYQSPVSEFLVLERDEVGGRVAGFRGCLCTCYVRRRERLKRAVVWSSAVLWCFGVGFSPGS